MSEGGGSSSEGEDDDHHSGGKRLKLNKPAASATSSSSVDARLQKFKPFIPAAYEMVSDASNRDAVRFSADGKQVEIVDIAKFSDIVLPKFFKHKNLSSFIRQLNMYGFIKCDAVGESKHTFMHDCFQRDQRELISRIERKSVKSKKPADASAASAAPQHQQQQQQLNLVHSTHAAAEDLRKLKQIQLAHEERIKQLEQENAHLTEENERIRQAITQVKGAQQAMTDRLRQLFMYFLKFYVRDGQQQQPQLSEGDLRALMNTGGLFNLDGEQQHMVNTFLQLQNGDAPAQAAAAAAATAPLARMDSMDDYAKMFLEEEEEEDEPQPQPAAQQAATAAAPPAVPVVVAQQGDDEEEEDDLDNVLLGRSHSLASQNSFLRSDTLASTSGGMMGQLTAPGGGGDQQSKYQSFARDLGEHIERNEDAMKRIDTLTTAALMNERHPASALRSASSSSSAAAADGNFGLLDYEGSGGDGGDGDDDDDEEEAFTRS